MFDRITIQRQNTAGEPLDLGFLAECLVFYRKVRVIADPDIFKFLVTACGPDALLELLEMGALEIEFFDNLSAIMTVPVSDGGEAHDVGYMTAHVIRYQQVARKLFDELTSPSGKGANRLFNKFDRFVIRSEYPEDILPTIRADFRDECYLETAVRSLLAYLASEYPIPAPLSFRPRLIPKIGLRIETNIDFAAVNTSYHKRVLPSHSSISTAYLLANIADTRRNITVASERSSDLAIAPIQSIMAACKFAEILSTASSHIQVMDVFQEVTISELPDIRAAVNSGQRVFSDVVALVRAAAKFKDWLAGIDDKRAVTTEYCRDVSRLDWADKLPPKSIRCLIFWVLGIATGVFNPAVGAVGSAALSAADYFLLDKLIKGWKPNQFVEGPLKKSLKIE